METKELEGIVLTQPKNTIGLWCHDGQTRYPPQGHYGLVIDGREGLAHFVNLVCDLFDEAEAKQETIDSYGSFLIVMPDGQTAVLIRY